MIAGVSPPPTFVLPSKYVVSQSYDRLGLASSNPPIENCGVGWEDVVFVDWVNFFGHWVRTTIDRRLARDDKAKPERSSWTVHTIHYPLLQS